MYNLVGETPGIVSETSSRINGQYFEVLGKLRSRVKKVCGKVICRSLLDPCSDFLRVFEYFAEKSKFKDFFCLASEPVCLPWRLGWSDLVSCNFCSCFESASFGISRDWLDWISRCSECLKEVLSWTSLISRHSDSSLTESLVSRCLDLISCSSIWGRKQKPNFLKKLVNFFLAKELCS